MGSQIHSVNVRITLWYVLLVVISAVSPSSPHILTPIYSLVVISAVSSSSPHILTPIYSLVPSSTCLFNSGVHEDVVEMCALDKEADDDKSILRI